ncbi:MAG TPA: TonB-dependent receptor [Rubricoccaceae bacterium]|jgi:iron complex outermembrane receptor protein
MSVRLAFLVALCAASAYGPVSAQAVPTSGRTLDVTVRDASGEALPGAIVRAPRTGAGAATGADGVARLVALPADTLTVEVRFVGLVTDRRVVDLRTAGAAFSVTLADDSQSLGEVQVSTDGAGDPLTRDVRSVGVLTARELDETRGATLGESLERINGVTTLSTGPSISKPVVRGLHSERVVVLNDGVRQEGQQWGGEHAPEIDPFAPARVEVVRGAAGVEVGAGAIGGVIRVKERDLPTAPGVGGRLSTQAFSNSGQGAVSGYVEGASTRVPGLAARAQLSLRRSGDARTPDYVLRNSAYAEAAGQVTVGYTSGPLRLTAHASRFATTLGIYRGSHFGNAADLAAIIERGGPDPAWDYAFSYAIDRPSQEVTHDVGSLRGVLALPHGDRLEAQVATQRNVRQEFDSHRAYNDSLAALDRPSFDLTLATQTADVVYRLAPRGRFFGAAGISGMNQGNVNGASGYLIPNFRAYTGGAFVHGDWHATDRLTVESGTRLDVRWQQAFPYSRSDRAYTREVHQWTGGSGTLGALYRLSGAWSLAANAGTAWRPPGINELYANGVHHGTARYERGNAALTPERSLDLTATLRHESRWISAEVAAYRNAISDFVYLVEAPAPTVTIRGTFPTYDTVQDDVVLRGVDAQLDVRPLGWLTLGAQASVLRADNVTVGGPLYQMPADRLRLRARVHGSRLGPFRGPYAEAEGLLVRRQDRLQPGAFEPLAPPPGYALADIRLGAEIAAFGQPATLSIGVQNVFDVRYRDYLSRFRYFADEPGRNAVVRLSVPFGRVAE